MNIDLNFPVLENEYDSASESLAEVHIEHKGGQTSLAVNGTDGHYRVVVETDSRGDVLLKLTDHNEEFIIAQATATKQQYAIQLPPADETLADWRKAIAYRGREDTPSEDAIIEVIKLLPVTDVWSEIPEGGVWVLHVELARSLTLAESFSLARLNFKRWDVAPDLTVALIWD